jgi:hypothetical protein
MAAALAPAAQAQQTIDLSAGPVDYTSWTLFGSATARNETPGNGFRYSLLSLTQSGTGDQAGAAFAPVPVALDLNQAFAVHFNWYIPPSAGADTLRGDGMTLVLTGTPALGSGGTGLGYEGAASASIAWAIDTFHFDGEPISPSLQLLAGGGIQPLAAAETGLGDSIRGTPYQWFGTLAYTPSGNGDFRGLLAATMTNIEVGGLPVEFSVSAPIDFDVLGMAGLPGLYVGFTAANGAAIDGHHTSFGAPVPEPQTWAMLLGGLLALGWLARRQQHQRAG